MQETDWQTWAALAVVLATVVVFALRARRRKSKSGCQSCGSDKSCE